MGHKILERTLCPSCEREFTALNIVHKKVPYTEGTAICDKCHKKRYSARYKVRIGKEDGDGQAEANQP